MRLRALAALVVLLGAAGPAAAQADDPQAKAAAQALFDQATVLMDKHAYRAACPKLEEVLHLQPGKVGTMLALAECYEGDGRLASAWVSYRAAEGRADALHDPRAAAAKAKGDKLAARLPRLRLRVDPATRGAAGLEVTRDGLAVGAAQWGDPLPIDPGDHVVEAHAPGFQPLRAAFSVKEGETREMSVRLDPVAAAAPVLAPAAVVVAPAVAAVPAPALAPARERRSFFARHRGSALAGGAAVVLAAAGVGVSVAAWQGYDHLASTCTRPCTGTGGVKGEAMAANVLYGVAGAAAVTSVGLFVLVERDRGSVSVGPTQGGARAVLRF